MNSNVSLNGKNWITFIIICTISCFFFVKKKLWVVIANVDHCLHCLPVWLVQFVFYIMPSSIFYRDSDGPAGRLYAFYKAFYSSNAYFIETVPVQLVHFAFYIMPSNIPVYILQGRIRSNWYILRFT